MALTLPVHSTLRSTPPLVISMSTWNNNKQWNISDTTVVMSWTNCHLHSVHSDKEPHLLHWLVVVLGVHKVSAAKFLSWKLGKVGKFNVPSGTICQTVNLQLSSQQFVHTLLIFCRVHVHTDDPWCPSQPGTFHGLIMWKHTETISQF